MCDGKLLETVEKQNAIIRIQSDVIDELFCLLMQHISVEEVDRLPVIDKINQATTLRRSVSGEV